MNQTVSESYYPLSFRSEDAMSLGESLKHRHCVELIGMKRVGINNFLRFFLNHEHIKSTYIHDHRQHLFIPVDLNDLIERELYPFWILSFKRLVDQLDDSSLSEETKQLISSLFSVSIQSKDLFLTIENIRRSLRELVKGRVYPTFFFIRFERIKNVASPEFFDNLHGLRDATEQKVSYVFTSFKPLSYLFSETLPKNSFAVLESLYIKPAEKSDMETIFQTFQRKYHLTAPQSLIEQAMQLSGGHVQYFQLSLLIIYQKLKETEVVTNLPDLIHQDERIALLSEEIWESLTPDEQSILQQFSQTHTLSEKDKQTGRYLLESGILYEHDSSYQFFSQLFAGHTERKHQFIKADGQMDLTKKEHQLYQVLLNNLNQICDREMIIPQVWPEYEEFGVSDWTIDRLIARLRHKLKSQQSEYQIVTIKTRGYKLVNKPLDK